MGMNLPERWGGPGLSCTGMLLALVEVARACAATSSMIGAHYLGTDAILIGGDDAQRARYLPRAARGEWLAGFALTEPGGGSNPADLQTRAVRDGDGYRLDGAKQFISNAAEARFLVVFAKTDPAAGARGVSAFVVETDRPGLAIAGPEKLMGIRAEAALAAAVAWAQQRSVGGERLADKQGIQWLLADMKVRLEAAWGLTLQALARRAAGETFTQQSAIAKLYATEMAGFVTDSAQQIHGGYGYTRSLPLERYVRDARILRIYEGASEIQRTLIARSLVGRR